MLRQLKFVTSTPKALANFSPRLERSDNLGSANHIINLTLKGFAAGGTLSGFPNIVFYANQGSSLRSNPGLKLANAFGVMVLFSLSHELFSLSHELAALELCGGAGDLVLRSLRADPR